MLECVMQEETNVPFFQGCDAVLHDRLYQSLGGGGSGRQPQFPFSRIDVLPPQAPATIPAAAASSASQESHPNMGDVFGIMDAAPSTATRNPYSHTSGMTSATPVGGASGVAAVDGISIFNPGAAHQTSYLPPSPTIYGQVKEVDTFCRHMTLTLPVFLYLTDKPAWSDWPHSITTLLSHVPHCPATINNASPIPWHATVGPCLSVSHGKFYLPPGME